MFSYLHCLHLLIEHTVKQKGYERILGDSLLFPCAQFPV